MLESKSRHHRATPPVFVVVQISSRRWIVAEQCEFFYANEEYRAVTKPFSNRIDAQQVCTEIAQYPLHELTDLARNSLLDTRAVRGTTTPPSRLRR